MHKNICLTKQCYSGGASNYLLSYYGKLLSDDSVCFHRPYSTIDYGIVETVKIVLM